MTPLITLFAFIRIVSCLSELFSIGHKSLKPGFRSIQCSSIHDVYRSSNCIVQCFFSFCINEICLRGSVEQHTSPHRIYCIV